VRWRDRRARIVARAPEDTLVPEPGQLSFAADSAIAILTVRSFAKQDDFDPKRFIDRAFRACPLEWCAKPHH
jgi:hypothetical protein